MTRRATLTVHSRRLTPVEIAQNWFRRGADFAGDIHSQHPDFPRPGPDGLFLLSQVERWFDRFHGTAQPSLVTHETEEDEAMKAASGKR